MRSWVRGIAIGLSVHGVLMVLFAIIAAAWNIQHWRTAPITVAFQPSKTVMPDDGTRHLQYPEPQPYTQAVPKPPLVLPLGGALLTLAVGVLQIVAGRRNLRHQGRTLAIVAMLAGVPISGMFRLNHTGILLAAIGLTVYFHKDAIELFRAGQGNSLL